MGTRHANRGDKRANGGGMSDPVLVGVGLILFGVALIVLLIEELGKRRGGR